MSEFKTVRFAPGLPITPLGKEHDIPPLVTLTCPFGCDWRTRVYDKQATMTLNWHLVDCKHG